MAAALPLLYLWMRARRNGKYVIALLADNREELPMLGYW
jgi:hypothetical protein